MKIVAADSGSAILDRNLQPQRIVATSSIVVDIPYRSALAQISDALMVEADRHDLIVTELRMCRKLLESVSADEIHIDMTLGGVSVSKLTFSDLREMSISSKAKHNIRQVLPELRKLAIQIEQAYKVEVLAIGKESIPVRIAELTAGAHSVIYASAEALRNGSAIFLGLPTLCTITVDNDQITAKSLQSGEHDVLGFAVDKEGIMEKVHISEFNNPIVRGFKILKIKTKGT